MISIEAEIRESIALKQQVLTHLIEPITQAAQALYHCLKKQHTIFSCGNGGSACDAQHFAHELANRFERERPPLSAMALGTDISLLTAIANDYHYDEVFAKQLAGLGRPNDILLAITTSGNSPNVLKAIHTAHAKQMPVIALTGQTGGQLPQILKPEDILICIPSQRTCRIQESHMLILHCLCFWIDHLLEHN
jgi:D-sedoheptulose 7-phosphate isomerase